MLVMGDLRELEAPADVRAAIEGLVSVGYEISVMRTRGQPNGNQLVRLVASSRPDVLIVRDGEQWRLSISVGRWGSDLGILVEACTGEVEAAPPPGQPQPDQSPPGLEWSVVLPEILEWLAAGDRQEVIAAAKRRRLKRLFPSTD